MEVSTLKSGVQKPDIPHSGLHTFRIKADPVYEEEFSRVCSASKIAINTNMKNDVPLSFSDRYFLTMACGIFSLVSYVPQLEEIFENGRHFVWFHSPQEAVELIRYYLVHPDEREEIARQGQEEVYRNHTYDIRIKEMLNVIMGEGADSSKQDMIKTLKRADRYIKQGKFDLAERMYRKITDDERL